MDRGRTGATAPLSKQVNQSAIADESPRVTVRGLGKRYGSVQAVSDVGFDIHAGEIFGLLGPNGAGKTTTVESIVGLLAPDAGAIHVCGIDISMAPRAAKQHLGVALQTTGLQDGVTPREAIESFAALFPNSVPAELLLQRFGLQSKADMRAGALSGGEKQRVALAMALVNDPLVIVLDEPTAGLDVQMRREFHQHIRAMRQDGRAILLTTHDMDEAAQLCDRIAVINRGRIIVTDSPENLIASLRSAARVKLIADRRVDPAWLAPSALFSDVQSKGVELSFTTAETTAALDALLAVLVEHEVQILQLSAGKGTLEEAIVNLIAPQAAV